MQRYWRLLFLWGIAFGLSQPTALMAADDELGTIGDGAQDLPLFDAHMHWKRPAWEVYPPATVLTLMDENGVAMSLVSSSPDAGTITLLEYAPRRIVPEMRPYNEQLGPSNWTKGEGVGETIENRVRQYSHQGIGEFHLHDIDPEDEPLLRRIAALAIEKQIPLHVHSGHEPVEYLYSLEPGLTIIWAHAGMSEPPEVIEAMMARYATLYADTSYREWEILRGADAIDADWRRVLERFADRFMVGSDTWINGQWARYDRLMATNRQWLARLSPGAARKIAYQNAARLFGREIGSELFGKR